MRKAWSDVLLFPWERARISGCAYLRHAVALSLLL
jgi:hypothetical protein